ncbi:PucR family transcriptional regulator [Bacillus sp. 1P06AnD]|uniref:PucR family transcriptional regulator n=1 Tax=Bacillus sp. 1P06AnD TaxID=3132208 RepID=UPI0039A0FD7D
MLKKLKLQYPDAVEEPDAEAALQDYFWVTLQEETIGIPLKSLTPQEKQLLSALFHPSALPSGLNVSVAQMAWHQYFNGKGKRPLTSWTHIRLIYFSAASSSFAVRNFEEAMLSFFAEESLIIWENPQAGFIIENQSLDALPTGELNMIIQVLESDFFVKIHLFAGIFHAISDPLPRHYEMEKRCFSIARKHAAATRLHSVKTIFPYLLLEGIHADKDWFVKEILGDTANDKEMIHTIKTYISLNRNASLASKQLFIHRNSLQYRIDKFSEKTNLDMKQFSDSLVAYLAILLLED